MTPLAVTTTHRRAPPLDRFDTPDAGHGFAGSDLEQATVAAFDEGDAVIDLVQHPALDRRVRGGRLDLRAPGLVRPFGRLEPLRHRRAGGRRRGCRLHGPDRDRSMRSIWSLSPARRERGPAAASSRRTSSPSRARPARLSCGSRSTTFDELGLLPVALRARTAQAFLQRCDGNPSAPSRRLGPRGGAAPSWRAPFPMETVQRTGTARRASLPRRPARATAATVPRRFGRDGRFSSAAGILLRAARHPPSPLRADAARARAACASLLALVTARASAALAAGSVSG